MPKITLPRHRLSDDLDPTCARCANEECDAPQFLPARVVACRGFRKPQPKEKKK